jgi:hypothetical protein
VTPEERKRIEELERRVGLLTTALSHVMGALLSIRAVVTVVSTQPTLLLGTENRDEVIRRFNESVERLNAAFDAMEQLYGRLP